MPYGARSPRRRDAQRNRLAILRAAVQVMTSHRPVIEMPEIARRAGVGQATLYRHFPDRHALAAAVITHQIAALEAFVRANADHPATFRTLVRDLLLTQVSMRPLVVLVRRGDPQTRERYLHRLITALAEPFRKAQDHGYLRDGLAPNDLVLAFSMIEGVLDAAADAATAQVAAGRSIALLLDGMFTAGEPDPASGHG